MQKNTKRFSHSRNEGRTPIIDTLGELRRRRPLLDASITQSQLRSLRGLNLLGFFLRASFTLHIFADQNARCGAVALTLRPQDDFGSRQEVNVA